MILRHLAIALLVPSLACASFEPELVDAVHPSLAAGTVERTRFELEAPPPPPGGVPPPSGTGTPGPESSGANPATRVPDAPPVAEGAEGAEGATPTDTASADIEGPPPGAAPADTARVQQAYSDTRDDEKAQRTRNGLFWTGVALSIIGGATLLGLGIGGRVTQGQLNQGYDDGTLTHDKERTLRDRGDAMNIGAATGGAVGLFGVGLFSIVLGVDYVRCGKLTTKRRKDCVPRRRRR